MPGTAIMHRRSGFTITEMLVSMALIMFIMVILSEAFIAGLESFRQLKSIGEMETKLRTAATILRRDLAAPHFCYETPSPMRLSNFNPNGAGNANMGGFFSVIANYTWIPSPKPPATPPKLGAGTGVPSTNGQKGCTLLYMDPGSISAGNAPAPGFQIRLWDGGSQFETVEVDPSYKNNPPQTVTVGTTTYPVIPLVSPGVRQTLNWKYIQWPSVPNADGADADGVFAYGTQVPGYAMHFTVNRSGTPYDTGTARPARRESYFTANLNSAASVTPANVPKFPFLGAGQWLLQSTLAPSSMKPSLSSGYSLLSQLPNGYTALSGAVSGQPPFYDPSNYYTPYAEVAYFLRADANQTTAAPLGGQAKQLYTLYRRQLALLATPNDYQYMNTPVANASPFPLAGFAGTTSPTPPAVIGGLPTQNNTAYYDFSWIPVADASGNYYMHFNNMQDLRSPHLRSLTYGKFTNTYNPKGWWPPQFGSASMSGLATDPGLPIIGERGEPNGGADVLLTNVVAMTICTRRAFGTGYDSGELAFEGFDTAYNMSFRVLALEITLRVYDPKTEKTRQLTIIQNM